MKDNKLLIVVVNKGFADDVVAIARETGATGATVISGQGVGTAQKTFLGISLAPKKEMVLVLINKDVAEVIYQKIIADVGLATNAGGICFCLPVDKATRLAEIIEEENKEE